MFQISCESRFICRLCLANVILQGSPGPSSDVAHPVLAIGDTTIDPPAEETVPVDEIVATGPPPASESETHRFMSAQKAKGELFHSHNQSLNMLIIFFRLVLLGESWIVLPLTPPILLSSCLRSSPLLEP